MRTLGPSGSQIGSPKMSTYSTESVDEEVCCVRTISRISINRLDVFLEERVLGSGLWRSA